jgi:hypothetical protein
MKINLRRFDVILIAVLIIMYLVMLVVESLTELNIHSFKPLADINLCDHLPANYPVIGS